MEMEYVIEGRDIYKKYKKFALDIPQINIPKGFATALIGENGAGKTTLLNILTGICLDYKGQFRYFGQYSDDDREKNPAVKERIGYTGPNNYYLPQWRIAQVEELSALLFENFQKEKFKRWCEELRVGGNEYDRKQKISALSDGNRTKLMLAGVLARKTDLLILDEPASPLDPLARDQLCGLIREYLLEDEGNHSVFFSTHNILDMENVTDYAIILSDGRIAEQGAVESLKEKYVLVKGEPEAIAQARKTLLDITENRFGFEGICLADRLDELAGSGVSVETPTLFQISVAVMKQAQRGAAQTVPAFSQGRSERSGMESR